MRVIVFGATGMLGRGVLLEALDAADVESVLVVGRRPTGVTHPKLREVRHADLSDLSAIRSELAGHDACFDLMGVSSAGMSEADYTRLTYDFTIAIAEAVLAANPNIVFTYVSGQGTDSTEKGRTMWARVKGRTENKLLSMPFRGAYMFRPGFIKPERGAKSSTRLYAAIYALATPFSALAVRAFPRSVTTTGRIGRAMLRLARTAPPSRVLTPADINALSS